LLLLILIIILLKIFKSSFLSNLWHGLKSFTNQSCIYIIIVMKISISIIELIIISVLSKIIYWIKRCIYFKNIFHYLNGCFTLKLSSIYMINSKIFDLSFWNLNILQKICNMFLKLRIVKMNKKNITFINFNL
jgi:hypothetical protein